MKHILILLFFGGIFTYFIPTPNDFEIKKQLKKIIFTIRKLFVKNCGLVLI